VKATSATTPPSTPDTETLLSGHRVHRHMAVIRVSVAALVTVFLDGRPVPP
jgi:hypothetical protein